MRNIFSILILLPFICVNPTPLAATVEKTVIVKQTVTNPDEKDQRIDFFHELFTNLGIKVDRTYEAMNAYAQMNWLRKPDQERWDMKSSKYESKLITITPTLKKLGMIDRVDPSISNPDYACVLGATVPSMRYRMQHMLELMTAGSFKPKKIIILTGDRPLDPTQEPSSILMDKKFIRKNWVSKAPLPLNESEAAKFIWDQLDKPVSIKDIPVVFITTPMLNKDGKLVRPSRADTMDSFIKTSPKPGSIVAFSNEIYAPYENEVMKLSLMNARWFKKGGTLETVGKGFTHKGRGREVANILDNVARYLYAILQVKKASERSS